MKQLLLKSVFVDLQSVCDKSIDFIISEDFVDFLDSIDPIESTDSIDIIDSIDSILVPHKETANTHTTHKGAPSAAPSVLLFCLCVWCECWRSLCVAQV